MRLMITNWKPRPLGLDRSCAFKPSREISVTVISIDMALGVGGLMSQMITTCGCLDVPGESACLPMVIDCR